MQATIDSKQPLVLVVMGVSGSGKSSIGLALAQDLGWPFQEGDELHPAANIAKMSAGIALTDADRAPWLDAVANWIAGQLERGAHGVITCSALRRVYRDRLRQGDARVRFIYAEVDRDELARRMRERRHFMPPSLLDSQLATLEAPDSEEAPIVLNASGDVQENVHKTLRALELTGSRRFVG